MLWPTLNTIAVHGLSLELASPMRLYTYAFAFETSSYKHRTTMLLRRTGRPEVGTGALKVLRVGMERQ